MFKNVELAAKSLTRKKRLSTEVSERINLTENTAGKRQLPALVKIFQRQPEIRHFLFFSAR